MDSVDKILEEFNRGEIDKDTAKRQVLESVYEGGDEFFLDLHREERLGFPEVIYGEPKSKQVLKEITTRIMTEKEIVFLSGLGEDKIAYLRDEFGDYTTKAARDSLMITTENYTPSVSGKVGLITAGSSDVPYADSCSLLLEGLGAETKKSYDFGAAGVHRPYLSLTEMDDADLLIVFAGMEGVLPALIASLSELPTIAVPTPVGYGHGGEGEGALTTMLQSCVPGILVVNIGNYIGAAAGAIRILGTKEDK